MLYFYDEVGNLSEVSAPPSDGQSVRNGTKYTYYDNGLTETAEDPWDITTSYTYNELGQQTENTLTSAGGSQKRTMTWEYYQSGNLKARSDDGVPVGRHVVLADSSDFNSRATQGSWSHTQAEEQYGYDTYSHPAGDGTSSFSWQLHIPRNGTCEVFVRHQIDAPQGPWSLGDRISEAQGLLSDTMRGATGKLKDKTWVGRQHQDGRGGRHLLGRGNCAEVNVLVGTGWTVDETIFTRALEWVNHKDGLGRIPQDKPVCSTCQRIFPEDNVVDGVQLDR
ncbi:hypothetical protein [Streptomyces sp.]|uniref:golvesin C-terminal-like domain-containing protein n=1 Tax=Streptomyces sp. TaxID=1931 RepID=UPI002D55639D|nr:hypothetical protein [Streptomyces sp.]HZF91430.1 hypothetical protein [Streptomyces sp.]